MLYKVRIGAAVFRADDVKDARNLAARYGGTVLAIPVQR